MPSIQTGKTAFQHAIQNNSHDCMKYLVLQCGVDPDAPDEVSGHEKRFNETYLWLVVVEMTKECQCSCGSTLGCWVTNLVR